MPSQTGLAGALGKGRQEDISPEPGVCVTVLLGKSVRGYSTPAQVTLPRPGVLVLSAQWELGRLRWRGRSMGNRVTRDDFEWVYTDQPHTERRKEILGESGLGWYHHGSCLEGGWH